MTLTGIPTGVSVSGSIMDGEVTIHTMVMDGDIPTIPIIPIMAVVGTAVIIPGMVMAGVGMEAIIPVTDMAESIIPAMWLPDGKTILANGVNPMPSGMAQIATKVEASTGQTGKPMAEIPTHPVQDYLPQGIR